MLFTTLNGGGMANPKGGSAVCPAGTLTEDYSTDLVEWVKPGDPQTPLPEGFEKRDVLAFADDAAEYIRSRRGRGKKRGRA